MAVISEENKAHKSYRRPIVWRTALVLLAVFIVLSIVAPFVNATYFSASVQGALEESLGRHVTFDKVYYRLLPVPGFSLENVTFDEDARFGLEPFSHMDGLEARLRIDKLLLGQIRFASLRLIDPSLNIVKRKDGAWNVVEFMGRMSAPRRMPMNWIPAIQVSNGRLDFKLGTRKTTLYIAGADLSIYPERSGRVVVTFSGSPARTDRAGNGFGFLRGEFQWLVNPPTQQTDQVTADVTLEPSNLSELTTLIQGQDIGVHGTIRSHAHIAGPLNALKVTGDLRLRDVHRWDLLPSTGDDWNVVYGGTIDMLAQRLDLRTAPSGNGAKARAGLQVKVNHFLASPTWTLMTSFNEAPVESLLPLARRMGLPLPADVTLAGAVDGVVGYSNSSGFAGQVSIRDAVATLPGMEPIRAKGAEFRILPDALHLEPSVLEATGGGTSQVSGNYWWGSQRLAAAISVSDVPVETLRKTAQTWFGAPPALAALSDGLLTGELRFDNQGNATPENGPAAGWSGQFQFANSTLHAEGIAAPLKHAQGRVQFSPENFNLAHFSATLGSNTLQGSYRYDQTAKRQERLHLEVTEAAAEDMVAVLEPAWRDPGLLARLPFTKRSIPGWMSSRDLEGDMAIAHFMLNQVDLGPLETQFVWRGANVRFTRLRLRWPDGSLNASGAVNLAARTPSASFQGMVTGYHWGGGTIEASGELKNTGTGMDSWRDLEASGSFSGEEVSLGSTESFDRVSGTFQLSLEDGWPNLQLLKVQAVQPDDDWSGGAISNRDGQLIFDLGNGDRQLHLVSALVPAAGPAAVGSETLRANTGKLRTVKESAQK